jgi:hypothetical protein
VAHKRAKFVKRKRDEHFTVVSAVDDGAQVGAGVAAGLRDGGV